VPALHATVALGFISSFRNDGCSSFFGSFSACQALPVGHLEPCGQNNLLLINCAGQAGRLGRGSALDAR